MYNRPEHRPCALTIQSQFSFRPHMFPAPHFVILYIPLCHLTLFSRAPVSRLYVHFRSSLFLKEALRDGECPVLSVSFSSHKRGLPSEPGGLCPACVVTSLLRCWPLLCSGSSSSSLTRCSVLSFAAVSSSGSLSARAPSVLRLPSSALSPLVISSCSVAWNTISPLTPRLCVQPGLYSRPLCPAASQPLPSNRHLRHDQNQTLAAWPLPKPRLPVIFVSSENTNSILLFEGILEASFFHSIYQIPSISKSSRKDPETDPFSPLLLRANTVSPLN